jgi:Cu(I)/Ag(I) efflux system membrane protein CusA/SilA
MHAPVTDSSNVVPTDAAARPAAPGLLDRVIDWSARNVFLVLLATLFLIGGGLYAVKHTPLDALPDLSDVQVIVYTDLPRPGAAGGRGSGHLSAHHLDAGGAARQGGARLLDVRRVLRVCDLRGRHRHLLGAFARAGVPELGRSRLPQGVAPQIGPDATGVGWVYQYACSART